MSFLNTAPNVLLGIPASDQDRSPTVKGFSIAMIITPSVMVILRLWSIIVVRSGPDVSRFWWDDWLVFLALPFSITQSALTIYWTTLGLGKHELDLPVIELEHGLRILFITLYFTCFAIQLPKLSVLFFYARVFTTQSRNFRIALWITGGAVIGWLIAMTMAITFQCTPIAKVWQGPLLEGHCINQSIFILLGEGPTVVLLDALILLLPMPLLWNLKTSRYRIFRLIFVFACGYCVLVVSIGRTITIAKTWPTLDLDATWNAVDVICWMEAEGPFAIVSTSIPAVYALFAHGVHNGPLSLISSKYSKSQRDRIVNSGPQDEDSFKKQKPARKLPDDSLLNTTSDFEHDVELADYSLPGSPRSMPHAYVDARK